MTNLLYACIYWGFSFHSHYKLISKLLYVYTVFFIRDKKKPFRDKNKKMTLQIHLKFNSNKSACHTDSFMQCEYE